MDCIASIGTGTRPAGHGCNSTRPGRLSSRRRAHLRPVYPPDRYPQGSVEGFGKGARCVPLVFHESLHRKRRYSRAEQRELAIKQAALRIAAGMELRSLRTLARSIGCKHTAIDNALERMCERLGIRKFYVCDSTRAKQRDSRMRHLAAAAK